MLRVGLTGNIGSGKSFVASMFSSLGVPVFNADKGSKKLISLPEVVERIGLLFGKDVLSDGTVDKKKLAAVVFGDPPALARLNALLHPLVIQDFNSWISSFPSAPYVIMEAAILFESGYSKDFDRIIHVSCPDEMAIGRVIMRDGVSREQVLSRMQYQLQNDDKALKSDFVIINDGNHLVIPQVIAIHKSLL